MHPKVAMKRLREARQSIASGMAIINGVLRITPPPPPRMRRNLQKPLVELEHLAAQVAAVADFMKVANGQPELAALIEAVATAQNVTAIVEPTEEAAAAMEDLGMEPDAALEPPEPIGEPSFDEDAMG